MTTDIRQLPVFAVASLLMSTAAQANVRAFVCEGQESFFPKNHQDAAQEVDQRPTTVRVELDSKNGTMTLRGTAQVDGTGRTRVADRLIGTTYEKTLEIFGVIFKYVLINLPRNGSQVSVVASTHTSLEPADAAGRAMFLGTCRKG
jgi:hypothetical protein